MSFPHPSIMSAKCCIVRYSCSKGRLQYIHYTRWTDERKEHYIFACGQVDKGGGRGLYCNDSNYMENIILTKVTRTGNSLTIVIPKNVCTALNIQRGDQMSFGVYSDDVICIKKLTQRELQNLKPKNIYE